MERMVSTNFFKVLYLLTHGLYTLFELFYQYIIHVNVAIRTLFNDFSSKTERTKSLENRLILISKKPKHITVILGAEETNFKDIAKLIIWCITTQISFISFYDYNDILKKHSEELEYEVSQIKGNNDHVIWYTDQKSTYKNGFIGNKIYVKIISSEDGRKSVVNLAKNLASKDLNKIDINEVNNHLSKQYQFPDPDVGLICGDVFSLFNYPPWQIRLTEFFKLDHVKDITLPVFLDILCKYSKCEQRLGK